MGTDGGRGHDTTQFFFSSWHKSSFSVHDFVLEVWTIEQILEFKVREWTPSSDAYQSCYLFHLGLSGKQGLLGDELTCWDFARSSGDQLWSTCAVFHLLSCVQLFVTPRTAARQAPLSFTISQSLLKFMLIDSAMHLTISSSATLFFFCHLSFLASGSFPMS